MNLQKLTKKELIELILELQSKTNLIPPPIDNTDVSEKFSYLLNNFHEAIIVASEGKLLWVNKRAFEITGWNKEELLGKDFIDFVYPEDRKLVIENHAKITSGKTDFLNEYRFRVINKSGNILWVENRPSTFIWNGKKASISMILDITDQVKTRNELDVNLRRYKTIFDNSIESIIVMRDFKLLYWNKTTEIMFQETSEKLLGTSISKYIHPDDLHIPVEHYQKRINGIKTDEKYTIRLITGKGKLLYGELKAVIIDWEGKPASLVFISDVTEKKLSELNLRVSYERYKNLIEESIQGIVVNYNLKMIFVNEAFAKILKATKDELIGSNIRDHMVSEDADLLEYYYNLRMNNISVPEEYPVRVYDANGEIRWIIIKPNVTIWEGKKVVLASVIDITDIKEAENSIMEKNVLLESLINASSEDIICFKDASGKWLKANDAILKLFELDGVNYISKTDSELSVYSPYYKDSIYRLMKNNSNVWDKKSVLREDVSIPVKGHQERIFDVIKVPIFGDNGEKKGLIIFGRDVTEARIEKQIAEEAKESYSYIVHLFKYISDSSPDFLWAKDTEQKYIFTNLPLRKMFFNIENYKDVLYKTEDELIGENSLFNDEGRKAFTFSSISAEYEEIALEMLEPQEFEKEGYIDGTNYIFKFYVAPFYDENGKLLGTIGSGRNVTSEINALNELAANERKYRTLISNLHESIVITRKSKIIFANEAFIRLTEMSEEELYNLSFISLIKPTYRHSVIEYDGSDYNFKISDEPYEFELILPNEREITIINRNVVIDWDNETAVLNLFRNITTEKQALEENRKLSKAVKQSPLMIIITDIDGVIEYVNPHFTEITGFSADEAIGQKPSILKSGTETEEFYKDMWDTILYGITWSGEYQNKKKNGELYWCYNTISPIFDDDGKITNFLAIQTDVSEQHRINEELRYAKEAAEKADRLKTEFLAQISHEIRTPINALLSFSGFMKSEIEDLLDEDLRAGFINMENAGKRIIRTIDLILNMSELQIGSYDYFPKNLNLSGLLAGIFLTVQPVAQAKGLIIKFEDNLKNPIVYKDEYSIHQIFQNLVDNGIKFTKKGKVILRAYDDKNIVYVEVEDTGIGIGEEYMNNLFKPFMQEEQGYSRKYEGNGLGLALVAQYVELNGGKITVESKKHKGTKFIISFPRSNTDK